MYKLYKPIFWPYGQPQCTLQNTHRHEQTQYNMQNQCLWNAI